MNNPLLAGATANSPVGRGAVSSIWRGKLIVTLPRAGQRRVDELLRLLRGHSAQTYRWGHLPAEPPGRQRDPLPADASGRVWLIPRTPEAPGPKTLRRYDVSALISKGDRDAFEELAERESRLLAGPITAAGQNIRGLTGYGVVFIPSGELIQLGSRRLLSALTRGLPSLQLDGMSHPSPPQFWLWADRLISVQTVEGHQRIADYLEWLRRTEEPYWR